MQDIDFNNNSFGVIKINGVELIYEEHDNTSDTGRFENENNNASCSKF